MGAKKTIKTAGVSAVVKIWEQYWKEHKVCGAKNN
jgi:hypothetical protein